MCVCVFICKNLNNFVVKKKTKKHFFARWIYELRMSHICEIFSGLFPGAAAPRLQSHFGHAVKKKSAIEFLPSGIRSLFLFLLPYLSDESFKKKK